MQRAQRKKMRVFADYAGSYFYQRFPLCFCGRRFPALFFILSYHFVFCIMKSVYLIALSILAVTCIVSLVVSHLSLLNSDSHFISNENSPNMLRSVYYTKAAMTANEYIRIGSLRYEPPDDSPPNIPTPPISQDQLNQNKDVEKRVSVRAQLGYEGDKDALHLGGFTAIDMEGISPKVWRDMLEYLGVRSLLDIGCGKGVSTSWFYLQGVDSFCVEGSQDALKQNLLPKVIHTEDGIDMEIRRLVIEHDFSRGPWWPDHSVDAVWCVEFLEHVGRPFMFNYMAAMKKAAVIFATHSTWGGWHHVEVHDDAYWISKFESVGFRFSQGLTDRYRNVTKSGRKEPNLIDPTRSYSGSHLGRTLLVFINPDVAAKKEHAHLFSEGGCFSDYGQPTFHCGDAERDERTAIPPEWKPIPFKEDKEKEWADVVRSTLGEH